MGLAVRPARRPTVAWPTAHADQLISPHKKNLHLCILITFFYSCTNVLNSCMTRKDKYYVFFNVLKFEKYILYVKVRI